MRQKEKVTTQILMVTAPRAERQKVWSAENWHWKKSRKSLINMLRVAVKTQLITARSVSPAGGWLCGAGGGVPADGGEVQTVLRQRAGERRPAERLHAALRHHPGGTGRTTVDPCQLEPDAGVKQERRRRRCGKKTNRWDEERKFGWQRKNTSENKERKKWSVA